MNNTCAIILAAGKGTRMKSKRPKVLAEILFKPMIHYVIDACKGAGINDICVITGFEAQAVENYLDSIGDFKTARQLEQKGTGHAVMMAKEFLKANSGKDVLVICGDTPFINSETLTDAYAQHKAQANAITVVTAKLSDPTGYGRIIRNDTGIEKIVEQKDGTDEELKVNEINAGTYWFDVDNLIEALGGLTTNNSQGEYYLTDTIDLTLKSGKKVGGFTAQNSDIILGANSRKDLHALSEKMRLSILDKHFANGVEIVSAGSVLISPDAVIGADTKILPNTIIKNGVTIGSDCVIGPNTVIEDSTIGDNVILNATQCYSSKIHSNVNIGPFAHIRPNTEIKSVVHLGAFVETKNSVIGEGTGASHLTYIGDSDVGKNVNFGCGCVTVNYDGVNKHRCVIGDGAFLGCNTNLIAPVTIGEDAYTAAGSTITNDIPAEALGIARARQENKPGFSTKKLAGRNKKV